jgi:hypothetical protein
MRIVKIIGLGIILALPAVSRSASCTLDESALRDECGAYSQAGMRECLVKHVATSEQAIKEAEDRMKAALSRWDEDKKYVDVAKSRLVTASRVFNKNREAQCAFAAALGGGAIGNALEIKRLACVAELNYARARQVEAIAVELAVR